MKKNWIIIFVILLCTGCGVGSTYNIEEIYSTDEKELAQSYWWTDNIKKDGNTYYFVDFDKLYYWNAESQSGSIVCSSANCSHSTSRCNAYLGDFGNNYRFSFLDLELYNGCIYKIGYQLKDITDFYVYSISLDGSKRTQMGYLYSKELDSTGGLTWSYDWVMVNGYYYGTYNDKDNPKGLYRIRVDGEKLLVYDISENKNLYIDRLKGDGLYLYYTIEGYKDDEKNVYTSTLMRYNTEIEENEELIQDFMIGDYCIINDKQIFYYDMSGKGYIYDLSTYEAKCIIEKDVDGCISSDGTYIYVDNFEQVLVYDINGTLIDAISYYGTVLFGDEQFLFINAPIMPGEKHEDVYEASYMWILDKSQIGSETKEWMKMELII